MKKSERVLAAIKREKVDCIPAGFWFHYNSSYTVQEMIDAHMKLYREKKQDGNPLTLQNEMFGSSRMYEMLNRLGNLRESQL